LGGRNRIRKSLAHGLCADSTGRALKVPLPLRGRRLCAIRSTGCATLRAASLHPWLQPGAPLGRRGTECDGPEGARACSHWWSKAALGLAEPVERTSPSTFCPGGAEEALLSREDSRAAPPLPLRGRRLCAIRSTGCAARLAPGGASPVATSRRPSGAKMRTCTGTEAYSVVKEKEKALGTGH